MAISQPKPAPGYPISVGPKTLIVVDIFGNNNYQTTGDLYTAQQFGLSGIELVWTPYRTNSGTYATGALPPAAGNVNESFAATANNFNMHFYSANGTEVANNTNLAAECQRIAVLGVL